jgi:DNA-directed RNA polymerase specialized sigma24 family protein
VSERDAIPHGTVKTRVRLALRKLRDDMGVRQ